MNARTLVPLSLLVLAASLGACSGAGDRERAAPSVTFEGPPTDLTNDATAARDAAGDGGSSEETDAASLGDADPADADDGAPEHVPGPSLCNATMTADGAALLPISTADDDRFGSISPDERTIAWVVPHDGEASIRVADRALASDPFGAASALPGDVALDEVAISPDGHRLTAVAADRKRFVLYERESRQFPFAEVDAGVFASLASALAEDEKLGDPVLAYGEQVLVYSVFGSSDPATVRIATRLSAGSPWSDAGKLDFPELRAQGAKRRRPTGIASDFQTLFYWDEVDDTQKVGRLKGTIGFFGVHALGSRRFAQPNEGCTKIYFTQPGASSLDLWSAAVD